MDKDLEAFGSSVEARITVNEPKGPRVKRISFATKDKDDRVIPSLLDESQWKRTRGVALVHADSETLLGNFSEYLHPSGARRLVRETWPLSISAVERVEGSWWLGEGRRPEERQEWHTQRSLILHLHLEPLGVHAPAVELVVHLSYGGIARCELSAKTAFSSTSETLSLVELPVGTNVLERERLLKLKKQDKLATAVMRIYGRPLP